MGEVVFDPWRQTIWDVNDIVAIAVPMNDPDVDSYLDIFVLAAGAAPQTGVSVQRATVNIALNRAPHVGA